MMQKKGTNQYVELLRLTGTIYCMVVSYDFSPLRTRVAWLSHFAISC